MEAASWGLRCRPFGCPTHSAPIISPDQRSVILESRVPPPNRAVDLQVLHDPLCFVSSKFALSEGSGSRWVTPSLVPLSRETRLVASRLRTHALRDYQRPSHYALGYQIPTSGPDLKFVSKYWPERRQQTSTAWLCCRVYLLQEHRLQNELTWISSGFLPSCFGVVPTSRKLQCALWLGLF